MDSDSSAKSSGERVEIFFSYLITVLPNFTFELFSEEREHFIKPISFAVNRDINLKRLDGETDSNLTPKIEDLLMDRTDLLCNFKSEDNIRTMNFRIYFIYDVAKPRVKLDHINVPFLLYHNGNRDTVPMHPFMIASIWLNRQKHPKLYDSMFMDQTEIINLLYANEERINKTEESLRNLDIKFDKVERRVSGLEVSVNRRLSELEDSVDVSICRLEGSLSRLEAEVKQAKFTINILAQGMEELLKISRNN